MVAPLLRGGTFRGMPADATLHVETEFFEDGHFWVAGCDEVGRGSIAGPLVVGAVLVEAGVPHLAGLRDSKVLSEKRRAAKLSELTEWAVGTAVGVVPAAEIDEVGMSAALRLAVARALAGLPHVPTGIIVDGPVDLTPGYADVKALPKADATCSSVAAASIVAKQWRDAYMADAHVLEPHFGYDRHVGYGTPGHYAALAEHGPGVEHRRSFKLAR